MRRDRLHPDLARTCLAPKPAVQSPAVRNPDRDLAVFIILAAALPGTRRAMRADSPVHRLAEANRAENVTSASARAPAIAHRPEGRRGTEALDSRRGPT